MLGIEKTFSRLVSNVYTILSLFPVNCSVLTFRIVKIYDGQWTGASVQPRESSV